MPPKPNPYQPTIRVAPFGELVAYIVFEHELDALARGSAGSNLLNIAYVLLSLCVAFVIAIFGTDIPSNRVFTAFVLTALVTGFGGAICLILGLTSYESNKTLVARIKGRMPPEAAPDPGPPS